jgi:hypothetical protein
VSLATCVFLPDDVEVGADGELVARASVPEVKSGGDCQIRLNGVRELRGEILTAGICVYYGQTRVGRVEHTLGRMHRTGRSRKSGSIETVSARETSANRLPEHEQVRALRAGDEKLTGDYWVRWRRVRLWIRSRLGRRRVRAHALARRDGRAHRRS